MKKSLATALLFLPMFAWAQCAGCGADRNKAEREAIERERQIREVPTVPKNIKEHQIEKERQWREYDELMRGQAAALGVREGAYLLPNVTMTPVGPYVFNPFADDADPKRMQALEQTSQAFTVWLSMRPRPCPNNPIAYCVPDDLRKTPPTAVDTPRK